MVEELRNEMQVTLAGQERTLRASFAAIRGIERDLGRSVVSIINKVVAEGDISVSDTAVVIYYGLVGNNDTRLTLDAVGDAIVTEGFDKHALAAINFLSQALKGVAVGKPQVAA